MRTAIDHLLRAIGIPTALLMGALATTSQAATQPDSGIAWQNWRSDVFDRAQAQNRFVIMDLELILSACEAA